MLLERRLAQLTPDHDLVQQRNARVYELVGLPGGWMELSTGW